MHRQCTMVFVCLMTAALLCAIGFEQACAERAHSLEPGSWSLQFQINDNIGLKSFNGMNVSAKRHWSDRTAIRVGVGVSVEFADQSQNDAQSDDDNSASGELSDDANSQSIWLDALYMRYLKPGSTVNFLWGVGPLVGFSRRHDEITSTDTYGDGTMESRRDIFGRSWSLGALGIIGAEWFLTRSFSFHTEYRASVSYRHSYDQSTRTNISGSATSENSHESDSGLWRFGGGGVLLGLSVYF